MIATLSRTLLAVAALAVTTASPAAASDATAQYTGCVSNAEYARLAVGQTLGYVRRVAGDQAQMSERWWSNGAYDYQERLYAMCTPIDSAHSTLTTRFMLFNGTWRAFVVDTRVGPEA